MVGVEARRGGGGWRWRRSEERKEAARTWGPQTWNLNQTQSHATGTPDFDPVAAGSVDVSRAIAVYARRYAGRDVREHSSVGEERRAGALQDVERVDGRRPSIHRELAGCCLRQWCVAGACHSQCRAQNPGADSCCVGDVYGIFGRAERNACGSGEAVGNDTQVAGVRVKAVGLAGHLRGGGRIPRSKPAKESTNQRAPAFPLLPRPEATYCSELKGRPKKDASTGVGRLGLVNGACQRPPDRCSSCVPWTQNRNPFWYAMALYGIGISVGGRHFTHLAAVMS